MTAIPDLLQVEVPVGGRVLVAADLLLTRATTPPLTAAHAQVAAAVRAATGPGVLVVAGGLLDGGEDVTATLASNAHLVDSVAAYAASPGRRVIVLPGGRDGCLAWSGPCRDAVRAAMGAEVAHAVELSMSTGAGLRRVRVEPGSRLDALARVGEPCTPREAPLARHLRCDVMPSVRHHRKGAGRAGAGWLAGMEQLDDPAAFGRFITSRLAYRRLGRSAWLLLLPVVAVFALRIPHRLHSALSSRLVLALVLALVELVLVTALALAALRRINGAISALTLDHSGRDPNDAARALGRHLVTSGLSGLVTGHTCRPELSLLGPGFYANAGCAAEVVTECPVRLPGLGLPPVFLAFRQLSWVELEGGNDLHVRLFHARQELPGATLLERAVARRGRPPHGSRELSPAVVATFPQGQEWPRPRTAPTRDRRIRRLSALVVLLAGFLSLVSALAEPLRDRLAFLDRLVPLAVPETAAALAALAGVGLVMLARGVRRGQRRAWAVCMALLATVAVLHLVKGVDVEETLVSVAAAAYLWLNRGSFSARTDVARLGKGIGMVAAGSAVTVVAGTLALELSSWFASARHPATNVRIPWLLALQASLGRMVGLYGVVLPRRLDEFFSPAMGTASAGLALALLVVLFRPVVQRRHRPAAAVDPAMVGAVLRGGGGEAVGGGAGGAAAGGAGTLDFARARAIVARHGSGTLDYFALRPDKQFFFWGDTVVAHAVYGGVCLVSPDPVGPPAERAEAWGAFRAHVDKQGWVLGGLGAGEEWLPIYRASGMHDLYVGDEAVVGVQDFGLDGGRFKGLRQAVNRVAKYGYQISFHDPSTVDVDLQEALRSVMTKSRRGDVERGFSMTLGRIFDRADTGLLLAVVHAPPGPATPAGRLGEPVAFCQFVPAPGIGGYSLDLMRRECGDHPNGLIDFAVVQTIRELKARGARGLGLNFATMRAVLAGEAGEGLIQRIQAWVLRRMGGPMQIESLWRFNAKFDPDWQPRYAIYDAPESLLAVAIAVARAESFWELPVVGRFLTPSASRDRSPAA